jgi:hypothetical protein
VITLQENVSRLQISVNDAIAINTGIAIENLIHEPNSFSLGDGSP